MLNRRLIRESILALYLVSECWFVSLFFYDEMREILKRLLSVKE